MQELLQPRAPVLHDAKRLREHVPSQLKYSLPLYILSVQYYIQTSPWPNKYDGGSSFCLASKIRLALLKFFSITNLQSKAYSLGI